MNGPLYGGIGLGTIIAMILSWGANHSLLWLLIHGFFGWFYVVYYIIVRPVAV